MSAGLQEKFKQDPNAKIRYLVVLAEQADTSNNITDWIAKGRYVVDTLKKVANATQPPVAAVLDSQKTAGNIVS